MNSTELQANYYFTCLLYCSLNGGIDPTQSSYFSLGSDDAGNIVIVSWNHVSAQPNDTTLELYTVDQVNDFVNYVGNAQKASQSSLPIFTGAQITALDSQMTVPIGCLVFNTDTSKLNYYNSTWIEV